MPRPKKGPRFGGDPAHQRLIMANLAAHLFEAGHIETTLPHAKALRPYAEHLITKAKHGGVHQRAPVIARSTTRTVTHKLFAEIAPRYADRSGGYLRILKLGPRPGDGAPDGAYRTGVSQLSLDELPTGASEAERSGATGQPSETPADPLADRHTGFFAEMPDPLEALRAARVPDEISRQLTALLIADALVGSGRAARVTDFRLGAAVRGERRLMLLLREPPRHYSSERVISRTIEGQVRL